MTNVVTLIEYSTFPWNWICSVNLFFSIFARPFTLFAPFIFSSHLSVCILFTPFDHLQFSFVVVAAVAAGADVQTTPSHSSGKFVKITCSNKSTHTHAHTNRVTTDVCLPLFPLYSMYIYAYDLVFLSSRGWKNANEHETHLNIAFHAHINTYTHDQIDNFPIRMCTFYK